MWLQCKKNIKRAPRHCFVKFRCSRSRRPTVAVLSTCSAILQGPRRAERKRQSKTAEIANASFCFAKRPVPKGRSLIPKLAFAPILFFVNVIHCFPVAGFVPSFFLCKGGLSLFPGVEPSPNVLFHKVWSLVFGWKRCQFSFPQRLVIVIG